MISRSVPPTEPSNSDCGPDDLRLGRALAEYINLINAGDVAAAREFLQKNPSAAPLLAFELDTLDEIDSIVDAKPIAKTLGDFVLGPRIGRGGMGVVYEAWQTSLNRRVALKLLSPGLLGDANLVERFHREAWLAASLHHSNIVTVHAMGIEEGQPYYAMELIQGETLLQAQHRMQSTRLSGNTPPESARTPREIFDSPELSPALDATPTRVLTAQTSVGPVRTHAAGDDETDARPGRPEAGGARHLDLAYCRRVAEAFIGAAEGLQHAHSRGVVHRDLKPANLIKDSEGRIRILDFGLAWAEGQTRLTRTKEHPGTLQYMSPERVEYGGNVFWPTTDIFALGASLYEMLTWTPPFAARTAQVVLRKVLECDPRPVRSLNPNVPRDLETIVMKCLRKDPRERYVAAGDLAEDLARFVQGKPVKARPLHWVVRTGRRLWGARLLAGTAAFFLLSALVALHQWREDRRAYHAEEDRKVARASSSLTLSALQKQSRTHAVGPESDVPLGESVKEDLSDGGTRRLRHVTADVFEVGPTMLDFEPRSFEKAVEQLQEAAKARPEKPIAYYHLARAALIRGDSQDAKRQLSLALGKDPSCGPALSLMVTVLEREQDGPAGQARAPFEKIEKIAKTPGKEWVASYLLVQRAELEQNWDKAVMAYEELRDSLQGEEGPYPGAAFDTRLGLAVARLRVGDLGGALDDLVSCREKQPDRMELVLLIGKVHHLQGAKKKAAEAFDRLFQKPMGTAPGEIAASIAEVYRDLGEYGIALEWTMKMEQEDARKLRLQAELYSRINQPAAAIASSKRALQLEPSMESHIILGDVHLENQEFSAAKQCYAAAHDLAPGDPRPLIARGICLELEGKLAEAKEHFLEAVGLDQDQGGAHRGLARILALEGNARDAMEHYGKAIRIDPGDARAYNNRGTLLEAAERLDDAILDYRRAVDLAPQLGSAHFNLGWAYHQQRRFREAAEEYREAEKCGVRDAILHGNLGSCLQWIDDLQGAFFANREAHRKDPEHPVWCYNLGSSYGWQMNEPRALEWYLEAIRLKPDWANAHTDAGMSMEALGDLEQALVEHQESTRLDPRFVWGHNNVTTLLLGSLLPRPEGEEDLVAAIGRMEDGESLPNGSPAIRWLLASYRQVLSPGIASYASIDALVDGPRVLVKEGDEWRFFRGMEAPSPGLEWTQVGFPDSGWASGPGSFGYPQNRRHATILDDMKGAYTTLYLRRSFRVADPGRIKELLLSVRFDDGFVAYLNGHEVARVQAGEEPAAVPHDSTSSGVVGARWQAAELRLDSQRVLQCLVEGENVFAVQGINSEVKDSDFALSPVLEAVVPFGEDRDRELEEVLRAFKEWAGARGQDAATKLAYFEARLLEKRGSYTEAEAKLREVMARDASRPEPVLWRAACLIRKNAAGAAEALLHEALGESGLSSHNKLWDAWLRVGLFDANLSAADLLEDFPLLFREVRRQPHCNPNLPLDIAWLLKTLVANEPIRINCGGSEYRDSSGQVWGQDRFYRAGWPYYLRDLDKLPDVIADTALYQTERAFLESGSSLQGYRVPLPPGDYRVTLHFMEGDFIREGRADLKTASERRFDVLFEGHPVLTNYNAFNGEFGVPGKAKPITVPVEDGALEIDFARRVKDPNLSGIVIERLEHAR